MIPKHQRQEIALEKFLQQHPDVFEEIKVLNAKEQKEQTQWALEDAAEEQGLEPWELVLELIATSPEELKAMRLEVHQEVAEALGMDWVEYRQLNELD
jgi:uncharacterized protein YabN with tetrapyrrole methylase and pyrophosphatase domain